MIRYILPNLKELGEALVSTKSSLKEEELNHLVSVGNLSLSDDVLSDDESLMSTPRSFNLCNSANVKYDTIINQYPISPPVETEDTIPDPDLEESFNRMKQLKCRFKDSAKNAIDFTTDMIEDCGETDRDFNEVEANKILTNENKDDSSIADYSADIINGHESSETEPMMQKYFEEPLCGQSQILPDLNHDKEDLRIVSYQNELIELRLALENECNKAKETYTIITNLQNSQETSQIEQMEIFEKLLKEMGDIHDVEISEFSHKLDVTKMELIVIQKELAFQKTENENLSSASVETERRNNEIQDLMNQLKNKNEEMDLLGKKYESERDILECNNKEVVEALSNLQTKFEKGNISQNAEIKNMQIENDEIEALIETERADHRQSILIIRSEFQSEIAKHKAIIENIESDSIIEKEFMENIQQSLKSEVKVLQYEKNQFLDTIANLKMQFQNEKESNNLEIKKIQTKYEELDSLIGSERTYHEKKFLKLQVDFNNSELKIKEQMKEIENSNADLLIEKDFMGKVLKTLESEKKLVECKNKELEQSISQLNFQFKDESAMMSESINNLQMNNKKLDELLKIEKREHEKVFLECQLDASKSKKKISYLRNEIDSSKVTKLQTALQNQSANTKSIKTLQDENSEIRDKLKKDREVYKSKFCQLKLRYQSIDSEKDAKIKELLQGAAHLHFELSLKKEEVQKIHKLTESENRLEKEVENLSKTVSKQKEVIKTHQTTIKNLQIEKQGGDVITNQLNDSKLKIKALEALHVSQLKMVILKTEMKIKDAIHKRNQKLEMDYRVKIEELEKNYNSSYDILIYSEKVQLEEMSKVEKQLKRI
jgi:hypothetical protein